MSWEDAFEQHEREAAKWLARRPVCCICHNEIQSDTAYRIPNPEDPTQDALMCPDCKDDALVFIDDDGEWE